MWTRSISRTILCLALLGVVTPAHALTQQELVAKLEAAGYTQVSDIKSSAENIAIKAVKNGKKVRLVVDSSGQIEEQDQQWEIPAARLGPARSSVSSWPPRA